MSFVHLHVHSEYSFLYGAGKIKELVSRAKELQMPALALTDKNGMYGAVPFYKECHNQGVKPVLGVELTAKSQRGALFQLVLLAKNNRGFETLMRLTSLAYEHAEKGVPVLPVSSFNEIDAETMFAISPFDGGIVQQLVRDGKGEEARETLFALEDTFGKDHVFIELQMHERAEERELLIQLRNWEKDGGKAIPFVATNHVQFVRKGQERAHSVVQAIGRGETLAELPSFVSSTEYYLKTEEEMKAIFHAWPTAVETALKIAEKCNVKINFGSQVLPAYPVPDGKSPSSYLREVCEEGVKNRFGDSPETKVWERLEYELSVIHKMNYDDYFLIVWDFMAYAHDRGMLTGPGRGSAAGSLVAYVLQITDVDPLAYDLLFERFLNPERVSMPDIDIDFPDDRRDEVIHYVAKKYGRDHVAQIITFGTLAAKAALRDGGRVLETPSRLIDRLAKLIPSKPNITLEEAKKDVPAIKKLLDDHEELAELFHIAVEIEGLPRHTSVHAAGVVISKEKLTDVVPVQTGNDNMLLTQYPMGVLEELGLLKMDFLGLRNLSFIKNIVRLIQEDHGVNIDIKTIPFDDPNVFAMLSEGDASGVFQLESSGMRSVLKRLKPTEFEDIVAVNALYRPGPMENIPVYIKRKHGEEQIRYPHPDLEPILHKTYGVMIYQEQIMQIASKMAGFSLGEADILRRAVGKKKREVLEKGREQFVSGAIKKGYETEDANKVYDLIVRFADYGFNRSHAVAYSIIAYQLAYLKANYPTSFLTSLLSGVVHHQDKMAEYISEARRKGIQIKGPSIHKSDSRFTAKENDIRIGLNAIKNVGVQAIEAIMAERKKEPFHDLFDLCARIPPRSLPKRTIEALIVSGACDEFGIHRAGLLANLDAALEYGEKLNEANNQKGSRLFDEPVEKPNYFDVPPFGEQESLSFEKQVLGFYASNHPVHSYSSVLGGYQRSTIKHTLENSSEGTVVRIAGLIEETKVIKTKKGQQMAFSVLSDETGEIEVTLFPTVFEAYRSIAEKGKLVFLEGRTSCHNGQMKLNGDKMTLLDKLKSGKKSEKESVLYLKLDHDHQDPGYRERLKRMLKDDPGDMTVVLYDEKLKKVYRLNHEWNVSGEKSLQIRLKSLLGEKNVVVKQE
ncbi:DNA polymerase III subunit alpha [Alteribacter aurantiacus]|uniref:DNA polymerase III subunit alpha n=1 Tax=Alteribacter aurantiacus TaxID=254410 RepID=UPI000428EAFE|nr:DNA polymerase III subunit alpha [Alteribacter aurantiacus]